MRIALALLVMLGACQEQDDSDTAFRCDATRGCPDGQSCEFGRCRRGGAVGEVACGAGRTCGVNQQCCVDSTNPPRCIPAGDTCPNGFGAICDGRADCAAGDTCCDGDLAYCKGVCKDVVCTIDSDCPSSDPHCCIGESTPWGLCQFFACTP